MNYSHIFQVIEQKAGSFQCNFFLGNCKIEEHMNKRATVTQDNIHRNMVFAIQVIRNGELGC